MPQKDFLNPEIQDFITNNLNADVKNLALKKNPFPNVDYSKLLEQILSKQKAKTKLPTWFSSENIIYPSKISVEQTSSEKTAEYKASLFEGESIIDLTGGFGIDDYYFSKRFQTVVHCEINSELSEIVKHNFEALKVKNINCINGNSTEILEELNTKFDLIYLDPSRRNEAKGKVFMLQDCEPNLPELLPFYLKYSNRILVKTAPILDIQAGLSELNFVKNIYIIALENEVKEILWEIEKDFVDDINIVAVNLEKDEVFETKIPLDDNSKSYYSLPNDFLYEPNAALMKSGKFDSIGSVFNVKKLHQHSHLYTSTELVNFQGRKFKINTCFNFDKENRKKYLQKQKMNVTTRNFPLKPDDIKKKFKITDGGTIFAFFTTNIENQKIVLLCEKI